MNAFVGLDLTRATILDPHGKIVSQTRMNNERSAFVSEPFQRGPRRYGIFQLGCVAVQAAGEERLQHVCLAS
jgi:hypothetical protein